MTDRSPGSVMYHKVWLASEMKEAVLVYCERENIKPSPLIGRVVQEVVDEPELFAGEAIPPAGPNYVSVYMADDTWDSGAEVAASFGVPLGAMIRVGLARLLALEGIPWDVTTARPRNRHIPKME